MQSHVALENIGAIMEHYLARNNYSTTLYKLNKLRNDKRLNKNLNIIDYLYDQEMNSRHSNISITVYDRIANNQTKYRTRSQENTSGITNSKEHTHQADRKKTLRAVNNKGVNILGAIEMYMHSSMRYPNGGKGNDNFLVTNMEKTRNGSWRMNNSSINSNANRPVLSNVSQEKSNFSMKYTPVENIKTFAIDAKKYQSISLVRS